MTLTAPKTPAQRQAEHKARQLAAGLVRFKRWVPPGDVPALHEAAAMLARQREEEEAEIAAQRARDKCIGAYGYDLGRLK